MTGVVEVRTGARLHFGLFATTPPGRPFGGIGLMIDRPGFVLQAWRTRREDRVFASPELAGRITEFVAGVRTDLQRPWVGQSVEDPAAPVAFRIVKTIPSHRGFGSGTQLAYAVAAAMERVLDVRPVMGGCDLGRGKRSAVGTLGFGDGGFITDRGFEHRTSLETRWNRRDVPTDWRFVIVDPLGPGGPAGAAESTGFQALPPMSRCATEALFEFLAEQILPGLDQSDFARFAGGIADFNRLVGEHFAPIQGGVYGHPLIRNLAESLNETKWPYLAQSSWGPAAVAPCESEGSANELIAFLNRHVSQDEAKMFVAKPMNHGATVRRFRRKPAT
ncbi:MAG: hypothetical protein M3552_19405 [Planctomycetota bacterium]|nr:hypothetical protein [Planctomycetaceae bacterium]MDQ3332785.1 hypothetical protein [Planctomycetota bacterium]